MKNYALPYYSLEILRNWNTEDYVPYSPDAPFFIRRTWQSFFLSLPSYVDRMENHPFKYVDTINIVIFEVDVSI